MNNEKQQIENIFNKDVELTNSKNQEQQQLINLLLAEIEKEETQNGNR